MPALSIEQINDLIEFQLSCWEEAKTNFDRLQHTRRKPLPLGDFPCAAQYNPARIKSTGAAVDKESIANRQCFLCADNRPLQQLSGEWPDSNWYLLVNPYPILPVHFTIAATSHIPQNRIPLEMASMAENAPELVIFFNGAKAGASAPDHLHCQAMLKSELPIVKLTEANHPIDKKGWMSSEDFNLDLPFNFISGIIGKDLQGLRELSKIESAFGIDALTGGKDTGLVNAYFWISDRGYLRVEIIPRRAHRPSLYNLPEGERFVISPGAVDMAGLLIVPREEDFEKLSPEIARRIYAETAFAGALPTEIREYFELNTPATHCRHD